MLDKISELEIKIDNLELKIDDIHAIMLGPRLAIGTGFMGRLSILESNITTLSSKLIILEGDVKLERHGTKIKLCIIWFLAGTITSGVIMFLINLVLTKKP